MARPEESRIIARPHRALAALLAVLLLAACGADAPGLPESEVHRARTLAAAYFEEGKPAEADAALAPLVDVSGAAYADLLSAAIIKSALARNTQGDQQQARAYGLAWDLLARARAARPDSPAVAFVRGNLLLEWKAGAEPTPAGNRRVVGEAAEEFRAVIAAHPDDASARLQLTECLRRLADGAGAEEQLLAVRALGIEFAGGFYYSATYQLGQTYVRSNRRDAGVALLDECNALAKLGYRAAKNVELEQGILGKVSAPAPRGLVAEGAATGPLPFWTPTEPATLGHKAFEVLLVLDQDGDGFTDKLIRKDVDGADWLAFSLYNGSGVDGFYKDGGFDALGAIPAPRLSQVEVGDLDNDGRIEALVAGDRGLDVLTTDADGVTIRWGVRFLNGTAVRHAIPTDFDADGDLDVIAATTEGLRLLRNDGERRLTEATPAEAAALGPARFVMAEDVDGDNDIDFIVETREGLAALSNLRGGRFEIATETWGLPANIDAFVLDDLDYDGRADLVTLTGSDLAWHRFEDAGFAHETPLASLAAAPSTWGLVDVDLDGHLDFIAATDPGGLTARRGPLTTNADPVATGTLQGLPAGVPLLGDTWVGDRSTVVRPQLAVANEKRFSFWKPAGPIGNVIAVELEGVKDNRTGVDALVEVLAGDLYQRKRWRGRREVFGLGDLASADLVRVTWPNGVVQHAFEVAAGDTASILQVDRLVGSCPFLYTWDGDTYTFISDVLGTTPLGLPMAPGMLVPPDHEEYVRVRGDQLVPDADGLLKLALTEELREVTYLDRVRLHAIDHPAHLEVHPDEAFTFPPFAPHHVHTVDAPLAPARAIANADAAGGFADDVDVTHLLGALDDRYAATFVTKPAQFNGLCDPWSLELEFGRDDAERAAIANAPRLRLLLTGWLQWGDASVNMAAARDPSASFDVPILSVPDPGAPRGWRPIGPPIGFPAGKTKTMIVDLTDVLDRNDPRVRLDTTLELRWDAIRLAVDDDAREFVDTPLEPVAAEAVYRGFSAPIATGDPDLPELFDWDRLEEQPRWDQHPGRYTRYGDVRPLLGDVDDRYVIFGAGDAVMLSFDAKELPPLPEGWTRDWLVYVDGWAKDRDPNTLSAERVEPLPFHAMSAYPPPAGEAFHDTPEHNAWQQEWNTREGRRLIAPLHTAAAWRRLYGLDGDAEAAADAAAGDRAGAASDTPTGRGW